MRIWNPLEFTGCDWVLGMADVYIYKYIMMSQSVSWMCHDESECVLVCHDKSECVLVCHDESECVMVFHDKSECVMNVSWWVRVCHGV